MKGYKQVDFMSAINFWNNSNTKKVVCVYQQSIIEFPMNAEWKSEFKVHGGMILDGEWYIEE